MAEVASIAETRRNLNKRSIGHKKGGKAKKKLKVASGGIKEFKIDRKMKRLFRRRAEQYNSDSDADEPAPVGSDNYAQLQKEGLYNISYEGVADDPNIGIENEVSDEDGEIQFGITKFTEGCRGFRVAFKKIMKRIASDDTLGPILSAQRKLVAEKLAEDGTAQKINGETKKEKHLVREKGHVKPANFLDANEKFLIGVATKGVVKLFNAVSKAQQAQKGLHPSRSKDAKVIRERRKDAFFSELGKTSSATSAKANTSVPGWAPLRDNYMLTNSRLKDWDKVQHTIVLDEAQKMPADSSDSD